MYVELPNLQLVRERHNNAVRALKNAGYKGYDLEFYVFPQTWPSTALGFEGIGGQAFTTAHTVVVVDPHEKWCSVFFGDERAYTLLEPNELFFTDVKSGAMARQSRAGLYRTKQDDI